MPVSKEVAFSQWKYGDTTNNKLVKFHPDKYDDSVLLSTSASMSGERFGHTIVNNKVKYFESEYSTYNFQIINREQQIIFTERDFKNIPSYYKFTDIVIHDY